MTEIGNRQALDLEALKELADKATLGPWVAEPMWDEHNQDDVAWAVVVERKAAVDGFATVLASPGPASFVIEPTNREDDARFAAAARSAVPALVAEVERLRGISAALFEELAVKDQAIEDIRALTDVQRVLADLSARLDQDKGDNE